MMLYNFYNPTGLTKTSLQSRMKSFVREELLGESGVHPVKESRSSASNTVLAY